MERTLVTAKGKSCVTSLSDQEALDICSDTTIYPADHFAADLAMKFRTRGLSNDQLTWLHILANQAIEKAARQAASAKSNDNGNGTESHLNLTGVQELFRRAGQKLKMPRIVLRTEAGSTVKLQPTGSRSRYPNSIHITGEGEGVYFGRITPEGEFIQRDPHCKDVIVLLEQLAEDPAGTAAKHGHLNGACCFCNLPLSDDRSTVVGYGPICARNYGLPWGSRAGVGEGVSA